MSLTCKVPQLRFREFSGEWEEKKLGEVTTYVDYRGRAPTKTEEGHFLVTAKNIKKGFIDYECSKEYVAESDYLNVMSKGLPEIGDVLFTTEAPMGNVAQVDDKNIALAQRVIKFRSKKMLSNLYLLHYMLSAVFQKSISEKSIGTTVQGISGKELHRIRLAFPFLHEQEKIASFLSSVDTRIEQLTKKKTLLEQYKKGVMQKIFSQELRFKDDDGNEYPEWEEKNFCDVFKIGSGKDYKHLDSGSIPVYGTGGYMLSVSDYLYEGESVCIGRKGTIDKPMFLDGKFWTVDTLFYTHSFKNSIYIFYVFQTINWKFYNEASGVPSLSKSTIEKIVFSFPSIGEQIKIANFISAIDTKSDLIAQLLNETKNFKKGLLQQMFA